METMRPIDADKAKEIFNIYGSTDELDVLIDEIPTIDPTKRGKWIESEMIGENARKIKYHILRCSICSKSNGRKRNCYCPNCGAKMDLNNAKT